MTDFGAVDVNVYNLPVPNIEAMREHLEHLFGGYLDGLHEGRIELAWTDTRPTSDGRYPLRHARLWGTDEIEELAQEACRLNTQPQCNVYIGAALRKPDTFPGGRAKDTDFLGLTCAYVDLDDPGVAEAAKSRYQGAKPTKIVVTGREPYRRAQMWWRLAEPIIDPALSEALLKGMASILSGDSSVTNPARVMRLAGSIAWPMKPERQVELTYIAALREPGASTYPLEHLARLFPPDHATHTDGVRVPDGDGVSRETNVLGLAGKVNDFRDLYMLRTVEAVMIQLIGETGKCPTPQELFDVAWPQYASHADLDKPGKGVDAVAHKCSYTVKRFNEGKIRGCRNLDEALTIYRRKQSERGGHELTAFRLPAVVPLIDPATGQPEPLIQTSEQFIAGFTPPAYLVDGIIQRGYLYSLTARTHHGKTAVAMYIAQCIARSEAMHGCKVKGGTVLILAGENPDDVRARFMVLAEYYEFNVKTVKMRWIPGVKHLPSHMAQIRAEAELIEDLMLVIVDTAAAYFPGTETNSNSEQGAYARLLRELTFLRGKPAVIVNCHPVKNAPRDNLIPMGGSAFLNEVDGNLTLWANAEKQTSLHWLGKFRGPEFNPMSFEITVVASEMVKDAEGRAMPNAVAKPISEGIVEAVEKIQETDEDRLLRFMYEAPKASFTELARKMGFVVDGEPIKWKIQRIIDRMKEDKLVVKHRGGKYRLTAKGKAEIGGLKGGENDADFG